MNTLQIGGWGEDFCAGTSFERSTFEVVSLPERFCFVFECKKKKEERYNEKNGEEKWKSVAS